MTSSQRHTSGRDQAGGGTLELAVRSSARSRVHGLRHGRTLSSAPTAARCVRQRRRALRRGCVVRDALGVQPRRVSWAALISAPAVRQLGRSWAGGMRSPQFRETVREVGVRLDEVDQATVGRAARCGHAEPARLTNPDRAGRPGISDGSAAHKVNPEPETSAGPWAGGPNLSRPCARLEGHSVSEDDRVFLWCARSGIRKPMTGKENLINRRKAQSIVRSSATCFIDA